MATEEGDFRWEALWRNGAYVAQGYNEAEPYGFGGGTDDQADLRELVQARVAFEDMGLREAVLRAVFAFGMERPSELQERTLVPLLRGHSCVVHSASGTGKTSSYVMAALHRLDAGAGICQVLVLVPSETHASTHAHFFRSVARGGELGVTVGTALAAGAAGVALPQVVFGTPPQVATLFRGGGGEGGHGGTCALRMFVLDGGDELVARGHALLVRELHAELAGAAQTVVCTGGAPRLTIAEAAPDHHAWGFVRDPMRITFRSRSLTLERVKQCYVALEREEQKFGAFCAVLEALVAREPCIARAAIFCNTRRKVEWLAGKLVAERPHLTVATVHGEMAPRERELAMREHLSGSANLLITTDLFAGRNANDAGAALAAATPLVVNFDLPVNRENYIHRVIRHRVALALVPANEIHFLRDLEGFYDTHVAEVAEAAAARDVGEWLLGPAAVPVAEEPCGNGACGGSGEGNLPCATPPAVPSQIVVAVDGGDSSLSDEGIEEHREEGAQE